MEHQAARTARREPASGRFRRREALLAVAVALVGIPFGFLLHEVVRHGPLTHLDERAALWLHVRVVDHAYWLIAMRGVSVLGTSWFLAIVIGLSVLWLLRHEQRRLAVFLTVVAVGSWVIDAVIKLAVGRARPDLDEPITTAFGKSFPSGHSMSSIACYGALLLVFLPFVAPRARRATVLATGALVGAIGISRLVLGVHFISDVLGGYVLGAAWLIGSVGVFETWRSERGRPATEPLVEGIEPEVARAR